MKTDKIITAALLIMTLAATSCFNRSANRGNMVQQAYGDMEAYENSAVNSIEQALPSIMVIPGDKTLKNFNMLKTETVNGREYVIRDYQGYLLEDYRANYIISHIQDLFIKQRYPLTDFEQTIKQLNTQEASDIADGLDKDTKTILLTTAHPDIILELNYYSNNNKGISMTGHDYKNNSNLDVSYSLDAIDTYTNKVISTINTINLKGKSTTETLQKDLNKKMPKLQKDIVKYFSDLLSKGREITVRISIDKGCKIKLSNTSIEGDTYADWIIDYIKTHTVKGAYNMQRNTDNELFFVNCRIKLINDDGTQYGVYDWARDLQKNLRTNLGLKVSNNSQGLGEVLIVIQGIN